TLLKNKPQPHLPPLPPAPAASVPLTQAVLRALVENYVAQVADPSFQTTRGLWLEPKNKDLKLPAQRPELLAEILLPPAARAHIKAQAPECLVVIPDGALHKLPFEALLLRAGDRPQYVLDVLLPLAYAPSVAAFALLAERKPAAPSGLRSLLTVANPKYREAKDGLAAALPGPLALYGQLPRLPQT